MAGNALAQEVLEKARENGETRQDVHDAVADQLDGLEKPKRAWCLGYLARLVDRPEDANPFDPEDGERAAELSREWGDGWRVGGSGDFKDLQRRVFKFRGE